MTGSMSCPGHRSLDLCRALAVAHAEDFRSAVRPFIDAARKAGGGTSRRASIGRASSRPSGPTPSDIRAWARDQGIEVKDRGRFPQS